MKEQTLTELMTRLIEQGWEYQLISVSGTTHLHIFGDGIYTYIDDDYECYAKEGTEEFDLLLNNFQGE